jgi:hypothetical protein
MITSHLLAYGYRRFLRQCADPLTAQAHQLRRILRQASGTDFGREHGFAGLARVAGPQVLVREYQARVPIRSHSDMRAELDQVHAGQWQRLCPSRPIFFALTAGSTGDFKHVPVTREFRREMSAGSRIYLGAVEAACPALRGMKAQFLVGSAEGGPAPCGIPQGFSSGFNYRNLPRMVRRRFILPYWIFTLEDAEDRAYAAGRILAGRADLGALCAISPVNLINLRAALERNAERLIADIEAGSLSGLGAAAVPGSWRGQPDPRLARELRAIWRRDGRLPNHLLFPRLQLLVCWQGGNMSYYLAELDQAFGLRRHFEFPTAASEGILAIPHRLDTPGGILAITSHFFEFLPVESAGDSSTRALRADEIEEGATYRVILTTSAGLYRYDIEDLVRVTSHCRRTPVIEFVSKASRVVSVSNERVSERDVTVAMDGACRELGVWFPEFLFVPCSDRRYRVLLDEAALGHADPATLALAVDRHLRGAAMGYDFEREDQLLHPLEVVATRAGELGAFLHRGDDRGIPNAQIKPMHLTPAMDAHRCFHAAVTDAA